MTATKPLKSVVLTFFRHGSNAALAAGLLGLTAYLGACHAHPALLLWVAVGLAMFPVHEYVFHRFALHAPPARHPWLARFQRLVHYDHHEDTSRIDRFFTPPYLGIPLVCAQLGLYFLLGASAPVALALLAGNLAGYLYYEWVHYVAHIPYVPKTAWGRKMKAYHQWHHNKNERYWFGVTTPVMDHLFRTYRPVEAVARSQTARRLDDR